MERFVIIVNGWKPLTIITKHSILDVAAVVDPPMTYLSLFKFSLSAQTTRYLKFGLETSHTPKMELSTKIVNT